MLCGTAILSPSASMYDTNSPYLKESNIAPKIGKNQLGILIVRYGKMSNLTHIEKQKLERELGMGSGYVLGFSNRTFEEFFRDVVGIEIYDSRFDYGSCSKANRMRVFWNTATDDQLCLLFNGLLEGWDIYSGGAIPKSARELFLNILKRLGGVKIC